MRLKLLFSKFDTFINSRVQKQKVIGLAGLVLSPLFALACTSSKNATPIVDQSEYIQKNSGVSFNVQVKTLTEVMHEISIKEYQGYRTNVDSLNFFASSEEANPIKAKPFYDKAMEYVTAQEDTLQGFPLDYTMGISGVLSNNKTVAEKYLFIAVTKAEEGLAGSLNKNPEEIIYDDYKAIETYSDALFYYSSVLLEKGEEEKALAFFEKHVMLVERYNLSD